MTAVILAAGFSKRYGENKLLVNIYNKPIICRVFDVIKQIGFSKVVLVYKDKEVKKLAPKSFRTIYNARAQEGISTSIKCALETVEEVNGIMFFMGDQPFLDKQTVTSLIEEFSKDTSKIVVPLYNGTRGNPVIFPGNMLNELKSVSGDSGGKKVIEENPHKVCFVNIDNYIMGVDIDTKQDYNKYVK